MNSASIFDWVDLIAQNIWLYGGAFLLVLGILVFVHEWGHYIVARMCGVRIESFSIGFGPELFGMTDKRGTRWRFSLVPLGGYVKMFGDVDPASARHSETVQEGEQIRPLTSAEKNVAFYTQPVIRRAAIVAAGPGINYLFAVVVMAILFMAYGQPVTPPLAAAVIGGSAAEEAGFKPHDEVLAINGKAVYRFEDIRRAIMVGLDTPLEMTIRRDGKETKIRAVPRKLDETDHFGFTHSKGMLGLISPDNGIDIRHIAKIDGQEVADADAARAIIVQKMGQTFTIELSSGVDTTNRLIISPPPELNQGLKDPKSADYGRLTLIYNDEDFVVRHGLFSAVGAALSETWSITVSTLQALGQMFTGTRSATELGGIIRIGAIAGDMAKTGFLALVSFTALLSINLGLVNLFPIPMLDGGHLVFYSIEVIRGTPISEQIQEYAFRLGLAILVGIMLFANLNDIVQLIL